MQTQTVPKTKVTTYFDPMFYHRVKRAALEENITIADFIQTNLKQIMYQGKAVKKVKKTSVLPRPWSLGPIKGNLSREEIYDYDFV